MLKINTNTNIFVIITNQKGLRVSISDKVTFSGWIRHSFKTKKGAECSLYSDFFNKKEQFSMKLILNLYAFGNTVSKYGKRS